MRGCHDKSTPAELQEWLALDGPDWQPSYPFPSDIRRSVVDALREAQRGLCVYCGRRLRSDRPGRFPIEHFRPQSAYPDLSVSLANLFLSCGPQTELGQISKTCGNAKGGRFDEATSIEPEYPACAHRFRFLLTGKVVPRSGSDTAADAMIELLNLNHRELSKDREDILDRIDGGSLDLSDFVDPGNGAAESYAHVVCEHIGTVIP